MRERTADIVLDISNEKLPYENNSVDIIFTSHTLEHIYPQRLGFVLKEFNRVLKDGGLLRILVPDIKLATKAYVNSDHEFFSNSVVGSFDPESPIAGQMASWFYSTRIFNDATINLGEGHVHCFDFDYMQYWLNKYGFKYVYESSYQGSVMPELRGDDFDRAPNDSLFVEATK